MRCHVDEQVTDWTKSQTWTAIQESLDAAEKMLAKAGDLIRNEFEKIEQMGKYRIFLNPELVKDCKQEWIIGLVNMHHEGTLTLPALQKVLNANDDKVRPLMGEADAKTLSAVIEEVDTQVMSKMVSNATDSLNKAKLELSHAQEARSFLQQYRDRVHNAFTAGLDKDYRHEWVGRYGHRQEETGPEWQFHQPSVNRGKHKP